MIGLTDEQREDLAERFRRTLLELHAKKLAQRRARQKCAWVNLPRYTRLAAPIRIVAAEGLAKM